MEEYSLEPLPLPPTFLIGEGGQGPRPCSLLEHLRDRGPRDDRLAARLLAMHDIGKLLRYWRPALESRRDKLIAAHAAAHAALAELGSFSTLEVLASARRAVDVVESRHAEDGAEDRRRRLWPAWAPWLVVGAAALFETWFFGQIFSFVSNLDTSTLRGRVGAAITFVPGLLLAVVLLLAGTLLGEPFARRKSAREGRPTQDPRPVWETALPLALCLLGVVGALAWARAHFLKGTLDSRQPASDLVPDWSVILLMVMVTVAAVLVKAVTHNPFADAADKSARDLEAANDQYLRLRGAVDRALTQLELAWNDLRATYLDARGEVQNIAVIRLYAWPSQQASASGNGAVTHDHPPAGWQGRDLPSPGIDDLLAGLERAPGPQPALGPLWHAEQVLRDHSPQPLRGELQRLVGTLDKQLAGRAAGAARADG